MLNLIKNEIYKIFHKKSTFILLAIIVLYGLLVNFIYSSDAMSGFYYDYEYSDENISYCKEVVSSYNTLSSDSDEYINCKTTLDVKKILDEYEEDSWQNIIIREKCYNLVYEKNYAEFHNLKNEDSKNNYDKFVEALKTDDWRYVANLELENALVQKEAYTEYLKNEKLSNDEKMEYEISLFTVEEEIKTIEYRLKENVAYGNDYLNDAIERVNNNSYSVAYYERAKEEDKVNFEESVKSFYENKYILETKEDTNNMKTSRAIFIEFFSEYNFLILVFVIMIAGGIVSDEFNKGTVKSLLITPYKRSTILLSKFLTVLLMIPFVVLFGLFVQFILGAIFFGLKSLSIPVVIYNLSSKSIEVVGLLKYVFIKFVAFLPQVILLVTLSFSVSTIINNTAFAIAITYGGMVASEIINALALSFDIKILNYFVTTNWDFNLYLFGAKSPYGNSITHAVIVCLVYFLIMVVTSFIVFKKKDIKNI